MLKKLAALGGAAALLATTTLPAFATGLNNNCCGRPPGPQNKCCPALNIDNDNDAWKSGNILSVVNTGNKIGDDLKGGKVKSGTIALSLLGVTSVNSNYTEVGRVGRGGIDIDNDNDAAKSGNILSVVNTGNKIVDDSKYCGKVISGGVEGWLELGTVVNSNVTLVGVPPAPPAG